MIDERSPCKNLNCGRIIKLPMEQQTVVDDAYGNSAFDFWWSDHLCSKLSDCAIYLHPILIQF